MTAAERMAAMRKRRAESGKAQINVTLPVADVKRLDRLCQREEIGRAEMIERLIKNETRRDEKT